MKKLNIALVAHDSRKRELLEWCTHNAEWLLNHNIYSTETTGKLLENINTRYVTNEDDNLTVKKVGPLLNKINKLLSGPLGGDQQLGAMIAEGKLDVLIFFCDNLIVQGHHQDVEALVRLASLYNIAFATNRTTADMIITSPLIDADNYKRIIPKNINNYKNRFI